MDKMAQYICACTKDREERNIKKMYKQYTHKTQHTPEHMYQ